MARPSKYNWEVIKSAYEKGFSKEEIVKKFKIPIAILTNRINKDKWVVKCDVTSDINEFNANVNKIAQNYSEHKEIEDLFVDRINTQALDNELIANNRKLAKMLQGVIVTERSKINLGNIKSVSSTLKDIESIANPQASRPQLEVNNANLNTQPTQINIIKDV